MLLAEANQWPEDMQHYFGDGDECHMAFHFPLMPRMYMAIAQEDRHPITDIMRQTPDIPDNCQWAIFLRNHDELTLEMVTDKERDYLWNTYAADRRARINLGIRRRLAPLMENDRRKIELMNSLLLSMPGTPVIYYGDEIGMGDNIYLGDRDGVRTPMQWSPDRNGGFSRADPAAAVPAADHGPGLRLRGGQRRGAGARPVFAAELDAPHARGAQAAARPSAAARCSFLYPRQPQDPRLSARVRGRDDPVRRQPRRARRRRSSSTSRDFRGRVPVELLGRTPFPPIGELPYLLTLPAYGFYWFVLADGGGAAALARAGARAAARVHHAGHARRLARRCSSGRERRAARARVAAGLPRQAALVRRQGPAIASRDAWRPGAELGARAATAICSPRSRSSSPAAPRRSATSCRSPISCDDQALTHGWPLLSFTLAQVRRGAEVGALLRRHGAVASSRSPHARGDPRRQRELPSAGGHDPLLADARAADGVELPERRRGQAARRPSRPTRSLIDRRPRGAQDLPQARARRAARDRDRPLPDRAAGFANTPPLLGRDRARRRRRRSRPRWPRPSASCATRATAGSTRSTICSALSTSCAWSPPPSARTGAALAHEPHGFYLAQARVARASAPPSCTGRWRRPTDDPAFAAEPITPADLEAWQRAARRQAEAAFKALRQRAAAARRGADRRAGAGAARAARRRCYARIDALTEPAVGAVKTRIHGDYPPRPGAGRAGRRLHHRLRGRAGAPARRAPRQDVAAARRRRHAALVRLCRLGRGRWA